ncbi:thioredoxin-dependent thiol peroxidase [bacterium]|nr:thioredoxin-dependent thiol peroxidase [candidate division CSSED10-310 bacterium]
MADETILKFGASAPRFCLPGMDGKDVCLKDYEGKWVVLYFYPKDNTSGCTLEAKDFTDSIQELAGMNTIVLGVSPDSVKSHCDFAEKHDLGITLLSDPGKDVLKAYGAWGVKKMYGKEYEGVVRSTFLIDGAGVIREMWSNVKVRGHVEEVKKRLADLQG